MILLVVLAALTVTSESAPCRGTTNQQACMGNSSCIWSSLSNVPLKSRCVLRPPPPTALDNATVPIPPALSNFDTEQIATKPQVQQYYRIGGQGGNEFLYDEISAGSPVVKIEAWEGGWQLRGVKMHFSNGKTVMAGQAADRYAGSITLDVAGGEYVTALSIWGNGAGSRCGAFRMKTSKNQQFFPRMYSWGLKTEYKMEVGSGIVLGMWGRGSSDVDSLSISMMRKITGTDMTGVQYNMRGNNLSPPVLKTALDVTLANPSDTDSDKGFQKVTKSHTTGGSWSVTAGVTFGQSYEVEGGVPFVAEGKTTTSWQVSVSGSYGKQWSDSTNYETSIPLFAPKLEKTRITVKYYEGQLHRLPYTANMVYYLDNKSKFSTKVSGVYDGVSNTKFVQNTQLVARWDDKKHVWVPV